MWKRSAKSQVAQKILLYWKNTRIPSGATKAKHNTEKMKRNIVI